MSGHSCELRCHDARAVFSRSRPDVLLSFHRVSRTFGRGRRRTTVLSDLSLTVAAGSCVVLVGPNGAGKSTALRIAADVLTPSSGVVTPVPRRAGVAFGSERSFSLRLSLRRNLEFHAVLGGARRAGVRAVVEGVAGELDLGARLDDRVAELSRGIRSLASLARCLLAGERLLLLDEPLTGLDVRGREAVRAALARRLAAGCGVLMSAHAREEASRWGEAVVLHADRSSMPAWLWRF